MHKGIIYLLFSAFFFALSTVFAKLANINSSISGIEIIFFRFLIGLIVIVLLVIIKGQSLRPKSVKYIAWRGILSTLALIFFFSGVQYTTIINANMLNMTYPIFVFLASPLINREKSNLTGYLYLIITLTGVYLITMPNFGAINMGDLFAFLSGIIAGFAISILREARKYDESLVILFFHMSLGCIITFFLMLHSFIWPEGMILVYVLLCAVISLIGQIFLTTAYKYINAMSGSLVSSTRILFAGIMGVSIFNNIISLRLLIGGFLILISLIGVSGIWKRGQEVL